MNTDELRVKFRNQFIKVIDGYDEPNSKCAFAAGMLVILSALKAKDGPTIAFQISIMHSVLIELGAERNWVMSRD